MHVNDIIHPCNYETVPEHSFGPHTMCQNLTYFYISSYSTVFHF